MREVEGVEQGSIVALKPEGRGAGIEIISAKSLEAQVQARAETLLDRELDRIARGQKRELPRLEPVEKALAARAQHLEREGWGVSSESGKFYFRDGAREALHAGELDRTGLDHAKQHGLEHRDLSIDPPLGSEHVWQVREVKELFAGRTVIIGRGDDVALAAIKRGMEIGIGDQVGVKILERGNAMAVELIAPKQLAKELELGRGLGLGLGR